MGRRSWRRDGAGGRRDMVVEFRQEGGRKTKDKGEKRDTVER